MHSLYRAEESEVETAGLANCISPAGYMNVRLSRQDLLSAVALAVGDLMLCFSKVDNSYIRKEFAPPLVPAEFFVNSLSPSMLMTADSSDENILMAPADGKIRKTHHSVG